MVRIVYLEKKTMDKRLEQLLSSKDGEAFCMRLACAANRVLGDESLAQDVVQDAFTPSEITLIENGGSAYTIVYADGNGADYRSIAVDGQRQIEKYTGGELPMCRDGSTGMPTENCILVGPTSFAQSNARVTAFLQPASFLSRSAGVMEGPKTLSDAQLLRTPGLLAQ